MKYEPESPIFAGEDIFEGQKVIQRDFKMYLDPDETPLWKMAGYSSWGACCTDIPNIISRHQKKQNER